jgi:hypothetical protein
MTINKKLEEEFKFYLNNQEKLVEKYNGKFIVIKDRNVIGSFDSEIAAYEETQKFHDLGTFLIQYCSPGIESYTQTFHSRTVFN